MLEMPLQFPGIRFESKSGAGIECGIRVPRATAGAHPGLRLRHTPVSQIEIGIVAACDPRVAACAQQIGELTPGIAARLALPRDCVELPDLFSRCGIPGADKTGAAVFVPVASAQ